VNRHSDEDDDEDGGPGGRGGNAAKHQRTGRDIWPNNHHAAEHLVAGDWKGSMISQLLAIEAGEQGTLAVGWGCRWFKLSWYDEMGRERLLWREMDYVFRYVFPTLFLTSSSVFWMMMIQHKF
jgi:hypothetical protein